MGRHKLLQNVKVALVKRCPNSDVCILAARSLRKQVKSLAEHLGGVLLGEDIECVHRARVASRRLRAVLSLFGDCWKPRQIKIWKKQVCQFAGGLSEARDRDVQIEFLVATLAHVTDGGLVPGIARLLGHAEQQRQWLQPRILQAVDRIERCGVLKEMQAAARRVLHDSDDGPMVPGAAARRRAAQSVRKRLKKLLAEATGLQDAEQYEKHHAMRIAAKRLRYTLELVRPRDATELDAIVNVVKRLQTMLGEIHDCDVWAENLDAFARSEAAQTRVFFGDSRRFDRLLPGLDCLRQDRKSRRAQVFGELAAFWQEISEQRVWERLVELLKPDAAAEPSSNGAAGVAQADAVLK
jgi:CHAD domain-containing protein